MDNNMDKLTDEECTYVQDLIKDIERTKDFGQRDMLVCKAEAFLKEKGIDKANVRQA